MTPEMIARQIAKAIREKEFAPGSSLIQEDLAQRFKVSRNPVREALRILAADGLVTLVQGTGARVRELSLADLNELYDLRKALELQIAPYIVMGPTRRDLVELRRLVKQMAAADTVLEWTRDNFRFHTMVYSLAERPHTEAILESILSAVHPYAMENIELVGGHGDSDRAHDEMIAAIEDGDADRLSNLFVEHLERTRSRLQDFYMKPGTSGNAVPEAVALRV